MLLFIYQILGLSLDLLSGCVLKTAVGWNYVSLFGLFEEMSWCLFGLDGFWVGVFNDGGFGSFYAFGGLFFISGSFGFFVLLVEGLADILLLRNVFVVTLVETNGFSELFLGARFFSLTFLIFPLLHSRLNGVRPFLPAWNNLSFSKRFHLRSQCVIGGYYWWDKKIL